MGPEAGGRGDLAHGGVPAPVAVSERQLFARLAWERGPGMTTAVGEEALAIITRAAKAPASLERGGNMSPDACRAAGKLVCGAACLPATELREPYACARRNIREALRFYGLDNSRTIEIAPAGLSTGQAAYHVGFSDRFAFYQRHGLVMPGEAGQRILQGFNAYFMPADERLALVCRSTMSTMQLAFELHDKAGQTVLGLSSVRMQDFSTPHVFYPTEKQGRLYSPVSQILSVAKQHYDIDPKRIYVHLFAARTEVKRRFKDQSDMDRRFPGWYAAGLIYNEHQRRPENSTNSFAPTGWRIRLRAAMISSIAQAFHDLNIPGEHVHLSVPDDRRPMQKGEFTVGDPEKLTEQDLYIVTCT